MKKDMKRWLTLGALSAVILAGCSNSSGGNESADGGDKDRKLIIYSNAASDGRGDFFVEKAAEAGFDIEFVEMGGSEALSRLLAEKDAPIADLVFGLNEAGFDQLRDAEILEAYTPGWLDGIAEDVVIAEDHLHSPITLTRVFPIYNADEMDEADAPQTWSDFYENEEFHGQYRIQNSLSGATDSAVFFTQIIPYRDDNGNMGISQEGWDKLQDYFDNGYSTPEGEDWVDNFTSGKIPIGYTWMSNVPVIEEEYGINIGVINPDDGVVQTVEQIGILADGDDNTLEQKFVEWFGSEEIMAEFAELHNQMPANEKARESATERMKEIMDNTTPQEIDVQWLNEHLDEWIEYVELNLL
ncbi:hypothetical protein B8A44_07310 [Dolosigranulum pigrum]|jgi:extracellular solute-binding protein family 1|uniref:Extracellular solute-binding protein n=2 Tax=Dolosigranulum TaxID=29393 RepID=A0A328KLN0_9LACT|nr:extracellular solute-binding protein [Dolosigranulum pigrum]RAN62614.1 hypothetical protein B8A44_07310 [Dolosigranulum pigrum]